MFNQTRAIAQKFGAGAALLAASVASHAQGTTTGWDQYLDAVDFSGLAAKIAAAGLLIIGIAIAYKGPDLAKRLVRKA